MIILKNRIEIVDATWYHFEEHSTASTAARSSVTVEATKKKTLRGHIVHGYNQ